LIRGKKQKFPTTKSQRCGSGRPSSREEREIGKGRGSAIERKKKKQSLRRESRREAAPIKSMKKRKKPGITRGGSQPLRTLTKGKKLKKSDEGKGKTFSCLKNWVTIGKCRKGNSEQKRGKRGVEVI